MLFLESILWTMLQYCIEIVDIWTTNIPVDGHCKVKPNVCTITSSSAHRQTYHVFKRDINLYKFIVSCRLLKMSWVNKQMSFETKRSIKLALRKRDGVEAPSIHTNEYIEICMRADSPQKFCERKENNTFSCWLLFQWIGARELVTFDLIPDLFVSTSCWKSRM